MGIEYYTFALFVFILACIAMGVARLLFNRTKQRELYLEEKEENLLKLYRNVEELVNELYERMIENAAEFQRIESLRAVRDKSAEMMRNDSAAPAAADPAKDEAPAADMMQIEFPMPEEKTKPAPPPGTMPQKRQQILALLESGMTDRQIADEMGITLSEVRLVKGLYSNKG